MTRLAFRSTAAAACLAAAALLAACGGPPPEPEGEEESAIVAVQVAEIKKETVRASVRAFGRVEPEPGSVTRPAASETIGAPVAGTVGEVRCFEGQRVAAGDVLFRMDARVAEARLDRARQELTFAEQEHERQQTLIRGEGTSQKALQEAASRLAVARADIAAAGADLELLTLRSPLAGVVTRVLVRPGEAVDGSRPLGEVIDLDRLVVSAKIPAAEAVPLAPGQLVEYAASPPGKLVFVAAEVDSRTDTVRVRASLPRASVLRPGTFTELWIVYAERADRLTVPRDSIVRGPEGHDVIALVENGRAVLHRVEVGLAERDRVEVAGDGLRAGLTVITAGAWGLPDGSRVRLPAPQ